MRGHERGNAIFIVLIGVVLFAAVTFVISSGRDTGTKTLDEEEARLAATEVIQFGNAVKIAVERLLRIANADELNTAGNGILFSASGAHADYGVPGAQPKTEIFHPSGGGIIYTDPPAGTCTSACSYEFTGQIKVPAMGTDLYEFTMVLAPIDEVVCKQLNKVWQNGFATPPVENALVLERFDGSAFPGTNLIAMTNAVSGKKAFCYKEGTGAERYIYVHVIRSR